MKSIASLAKVSGVTNNEWFIPTMFNALELDNSYVLWSNLESEYFIDTTNNMLLIKFFNRVRRSYRLNTSINNNKIYISKNMTKDLPRGFRMPVEGDSLLMNDITYLITKVTPSSGDLLVEVENQTSFINNFSSNIRFIDGSTTSSLYTDKEGIYYSKNYKSDNTADVYIDGADIRSIAGRYI